MLWTVTLTWDAIDWADSSLEIERTLQRDTAEQALRDALATARKHHGAPTRHDPADIRMEALFN